jgi:hypothetical protein
MKPKFTENKSIVTKCNFSFEFLAPHYLDEHANALMTDLCKTLQEYAKRNNVNISSPSIVCQDVEK